MFEQRYHNDEMGAPAYNPAILLKIILYAYSRGITSSRQIEQCCEQNIIFMALSADTQPHFTTIAEFISSSSEQIIELSAVLHALNNGFANQPNKFDSMEAAVKKLVDSLPDAPPAPR